MHFRHGCKSPVFPWQLTPVQANTNWAPSTFPLQGYHGIDKEVFLSLPAVLGQHGVRHVIKQRLNEEEVAQLQRSAETLWAVQRELDLPVRA